MEELAASIREHGVLEPVLFRVEGGHDPEANGIVSPDSQRLILVAGERRVTAARMAGLDAICAVFVDGNHHEIALVENLLRQDLTAVEEAEALDRIMKECGYKQEDLSKVIGKAPSTLSEILSLNRLPQEIRDECRVNPAISRRTLVEIAKSKQQRGMLTLYKKYKEKTLSKEQLRKQARRDKKTQSEQVLGFINTAQTKIPTFTIDAFTPGDKEALISALENLRKVIEEKLAALALVAGSV